MLNTREDRRNQLRVRARLGVRAELSESWTAGIRLATGSDDSPVSTCRRWAAACPRRTSGWTRPT